MSIYFFVCLFILYSPSHLEGRRLSTPYGLVATVVIEVLKVVPPNYGGVIRTLPLTPSSRDTASSSFLSPECMSCGEQGDTGKKKTISRWGSISYRCSIIIFVLFFNRVANPWLQSYLSLFAASSAHC